MMRFFWAMMAILAGLPWGGNIIVFLVLAPLFIILDLVRALRYHLGGPFMVGFCVAILWVGWISDPRVALHMIFRAPLANITHGHTGQPVRALEVPSWNSHKMGAELHLLSCAAPHGCVYMWRTFSTCGVTWSNIRLLQNLPLRERRNLNSIHYP